MPNLELSFASGIDSLSVRHFVVEEGLSTLFRVKVTARSPDDSIDLEEILGQPARFRIAAGLPFLQTDARVWGGVVSHFEQTRVEKTGLSTYELVIVPALWLLTQRRNHRLFQHIAIPDIVDELLAEWGIELVWAIDRSAYPKLELRTQYGESDHDFFCRLLEEAGITYHFRDDPEIGSRLVLTDRPHAGAPRAGQPITFVDSPGQAEVGEKEYVTALRLGHEVRPGRYTLRDFDFRNPDFQLFSQAAPAAGPEARYEQYHYEPSVMLVEQSHGADMSSVPTGGTPVSDDKGVARFHQPSGTRRARVALESQRAARRQVRFETNVIDLWPGQILTLTGHPRDDISGQRLLMTRFRIEGDPTEEWTMRGTAQFAVHPHRPPQVTPKPRIHGMQSAIVAGPPGEEIYTDEFGRVRVQLHWDREGKSDDNSSIWMRVSQGWAGGGFGLFTIPRVGHEVLVSFLDGDPDSPIVVGRVFNGSAQVPYKLPDNKTVSTFRSKSSPGSDGFNEIRFEDATEREHLYIQAQKDMDTLVKNDEMHAVGRDATRVVHKDETLTVGHNRSKVVHFNELETTGLNRNVTVGANRNTTVGVDDSTLVGGKYSVTMARGLTAKLPDALSKLMNGPLAPVLSGPITSVLGMIPIAPLGGARDLLEAVQRGPLSILRSLAPETFENVLGVLTGFVDDPGPPPTSFEMVDRKITLTTGEASIVLDGPNITMMAEGNIMLHARGNVGVMGDKEAALAGQEKTLVLSRANDVIVQAAKDVHLNPFDLSPERAGAAEAVEYPPLDELAESCPLCGGLLGEDEHGTYCLRLREEQKTCPVCGGSLIEHEDGTVSCSRSAGAGGATETEPAESR
ncbi:type VI secretion system Vgr family protein [Polyangium spumosum]|uniref:Type VI secretion system tip protein VgrG n=1 Tax=Polyangium spumosum TaxID=889282 RepID=A0A6N7PSG3_9BACT|nr:type VI secretion system tip protein TssI/VgrG [Polyangium spumosum]MRG94933.1 type VI secretion system tip protein VgrG [Polyangium spumosum]